MYLYIFYVLNLEYIVDLLKNLDAQNFNNCQIGAPSFLILAKALFM